MTPKERAIDLVIQFEMFADRGNEGSDYNGRQSAKKCAEICVDEMIAQTNRFADYWDLKNGEWYKDEINHLESVKDQINSL